MVPPENLYVIAEAGIGAEKIPGRYIPLHPSRNEVQVYAVRDSGGRNLSPSFIPRS